MNPHDLRLRATEDLIKLIIPATEVDLESRAKWVELVTEDLLRSLANDYINVTCVRIEGKNHKVDPFKKVPVAQLYVSELEGRRFRLENTEHIDATLLITDQDHKHYSKSLDAAFRAWMAICKNPDPANKKR